MEYTKLCRKRRIISIEFKVAKDDEDLMEKAKKGKEQIVEKEYYNELKLDKVENILTYCIEPRKCSIFLGSVHLWRFLMCKFYNNYMC